MCTREHFADLSGLYSYKATMTGPPFQPEQAEQREVFFTRVLRQHARLLYRVAYSVLRNPADAEDAVADAMLKLLRTNAWQGMTNEKAYLVRTVWRTALDRFTARPPAGEEEKSMLFLHDKQPDPEQQFASAERHGLLHLLIEQLPEDLRDVLLLSAVQELNSREVGEALNLPEGTVRTRLLRARHQLRAQYEGLPTSSRGRELATGGASS